MPANNETTNWRQITLFLVTLGILIVCGLLLKPFLVAIVGAIVIAIVTERPYLWLTSKIGHPNLCATLALIAVILSIIVPIFFLAQDVSGQIANIIANLRNPSTQQKIADYFSRHPTLEMRIETITDTLNLEDTIKSIGGFVGKQFASLIGSSIGAITQIVAMLFILFFLYRDRELAGRFARSLVPLNNQEANKFLSNLRGTIYATALGRLAIAALQGALAGLAYWLLGVPNVFLWGILTAVMAMVPAFGAFLVWVPIALYLGFSGHWIKAAILAVWGGGVVSLIDNFLYPILVGPHLRQHSVAVLLSILGGIALFGITGIILGPLAFTAASTLLDIWRERGTELA
ncbi:AI-2E family transporter [Edaphobacter albus]|uniref:AI-2E family transporter n=1 Tax=Edaphobacter sp. 4G125 TaxID=2763071 RepID=UPI0016447E6A|nr:AI-2E family transporter [Edaphobacter sp. 4G125]QNI36140.1 AI-2E family transporter [Edaphobacter sp. 4G125]